MCLLGVILHNGLYIVMEFMSKVSTSWVWLMPKARQVPVRDNDSCSLFPFSKLRVVVVACSACPGSPETGKCSYQVPGVE